MNASTEKVSVTRVDRGAATRGEGEQRSLVEVKKKARLRERRAFQQNVWQLLVGAPL